MIISDGRRRLNRFSGRYIIPVYTDGLSIDGRDACAWIMSKDQYLTLEEASSITFICAYNRMSVALE